MSRRAFLQSITALIGGLALPAVAHATTIQTKAKTLQNSPLAGFQYHHGEMLYPLFAVRPEPVEGQLVREADNRYDERAVRVEWQGHKLWLHPPAG